MWRKEKKLKYWLEGGEDPGNPQHGKDARATALSKLRLKQPSGTVKEQPLNLSARVQCLDECLEATACVKDGMQAFEECGGLSGGEPESAVLEKPVHSIMPLADQEVFSLRLPDENSVGVRYADITMAPVCRRFPLEIRMTEVQALENPMATPPAIREGQSFLISDPPVRILTDQIAERPHSRASVRVDRLNDSEREGFLREAEIMKGIPPDRAELLAVFRCVPIEMISRLRFLAAKNAIVYSIARELKPSRTRVHDMAAVRNTTNSEIHMIAHRTRFRSVEFS